MVNYEHAIAGMFDRFREMPDVVAQAVSLAYATSLTKRDISAVWGRYFFSNGRNSDSKTLGIKRISFYRSLLDNEGDPLAMSRDLGTSVTQIESFAAIDDVLINSLPQDPNSGKTIYSPSKGYRSPRDSKGKVWSGASFKP